MEIEELVAIQFAATLQDNTHLMANLARIQHIASIAEDVRVIPMQGKDTVVFIFEDHSCFCFRLEVTEVLPSVVSDIDYFLMYIYDTLDTIPQCIKDNSKIIGTARYVTLFPAPEELQ